MSRKMILYVLGIIFLLSLSPLNAANGTSNWPMVQSARSRKTGCKNTDIYGTWRMKLQRASASVIFTFP